jgi:hypothetical protein
LSAFGQKQIKEALKADEERKRILSSLFRRKPESCNFKQLEFVWTPVFAGVTTFYIEEVLFKKTA